VTKSYADKLRDPRWQKKRLEVLNRFGWACDDCGAADEELHVHHRYYEKGVEPWGYEDDCYQALCKTCHERRTEYDRRAARILGTLPADKRHRAMAFIAGLGRSNGVDQHDLPSYTFTWKNAREFSRGRGLPLEECYTEEGLRDLRDYGGEDDVT